MKAEEVNTSPAVDPRDELLSDIIHGLSQPLTTLECGLELGLRHDTTFAQLRKRLSVLLETTQAMHQRLAELRALQQELVARSLRYAERHDSTNYS